MDQPQPAKPNEHQIAYTKVTNEILRLTANLLRVVRGSGNPHEIVQSIERTVQLLSEYKDAVGYDFPSSDLKEILCLNSSLDRFEASAVRASLQIVASGLLNQRTQASRAGSDLLQVFLSFERRGEQKLTPDQKTILDKL